jgi:hypothetical protein
MTMGDIDLQKQIPTLTVQNRSQHTKVFKHSYQSKKTCPKLVRMQPARSYINTIQYKKEPQFFSRNPEHSKS